MKNRILLIGITALFAHNLHASEDVTQKLVDERICKQQYLEAVFKKHVVFSNSDNSSEVRREAERSIDHSRQALSEKGSFCDALELLLKHDELLEGDVKAKIGERQ